ncbi:hypothetical protein A2914_01735 [Candidatus Nomurabacteria bacterium RIFCSPLOWO2_01_FULL_41_21]|uniref:Uncharacterized protein n=1 Tax=Candidatus Nomurabacteria bacterium RIFCSPLOWO2_01_FULL_41_21 TaxID=1801776 RepID=A0A1F6X1N2_9BACT|nr:MAG: hypothetical protein A2914_01735 [Candidatus Nomurabacteria bacterium RIFCSPLOWO2_01_FULL_41_21]
MWRLWYIGLVLEEKINSIFSKVEKSWTLWTDYRKDLWRSVPYFWGPVIFVGYVVFLTGLSASSNTTERSEVKIEFIVMDSTQITESTEFQGPVLNPEE